jgi:hypothetical protein
MIAKQFVILLVAVIAVATGQFILDPLFTSTVLSPNAPGVVSRLTTTSSDGTTTTTTTTTNAAGNSTSSTTFFDALDEALQTCADDGEHDVAICPTGTTLVQVSQIIQ